LLNLGRLDEGAEDARRSLAMAGELGYAAGEAMGLGVLAGAAHYSGDSDRVLQLSRQQEQLTAVPGSVLLGTSTVMIGALIEGGDLGAAERACQAALTRCRALGDAASLPDLLFLLADLEIRAGLLHDAASHLREGCQEIVRTGGWWYLLNGLWYCGYLCTEERRHAEAITVWAAFAAFSRGDHGEESEDERRYHEALREARLALGPDLTRAAQRRGAAMSLATAAEYVLMLTAPSPPSAQAAPGAAGLSARERELVTLVSQGRTDAQIAAQLHISISTVRSHLDRIRDKTGCRRRADLTRLALTAGLV
jgi:DNA-binding CsgD family transcriptional regulator